MKPKNSKERRNSFLKFLLIFILTVGTIVTAVFFNFQISKKENEALKEQALRVRQEMQFQGEFATKMKEVSVIIDSLTAPGATVAFDNAEIGKKLSDLQNSIPRKDSTYNYDLYDNIIKSFVKLHKAQKRLIDVRDTEEKINEFELELEKCDEDVRTLQKELQFALRNN
ncbi:type VI secretion system TssO [Lacinutrix chionoecetis]